MKTVLFIGNFISKSRGSITPVEDVMKRLSTRINIIKASIYVNPIIRVMDMVFKSIFATYDIIHIDTYSTNAVYFASLCAFIGKIRNKKVILNLRGGELYLRYFEKKLKSNIINSTFHFANRIVTPSLYLKINFEKLGFKIEYLPNYVDNNSFTYMEKHVFNHKLLWVRAFSETYMPDLAIRILKEVQKKYADVTLTMIGPDRGLEKNTHKLITELNLNDYVTIKGKINNKDLSEYYHSHTILINTTKAESFGVAVMEAASCGLPVVSTNVGELPYLWEDGKEIMLIKTFNAIDFANAISILFANRDLYNSIRISANIKSKSFKWNVIEPLWINLFKN